MDELDYSDSGRWPVGADGSGATLAKRDEGSSGAEPEAWVASVEIGGTPGTRNQPASPQPYPEVRISEIAGTGDAAFRLELQNQAASSVSLEGMRLGPMPLPTITLAPGALVVFDETQLGFRPADGDRVFLYGSDGATLLDGVVARPTGRARWHGRMLVPSMATFGSANVFALTQDIVINEIMYHFPPTEAPAQPVTPNPEEWIELHNTGQATVSLAGWKLDGAVEFTFPPGTSISPGGFLVVARESSGLKAKWPEVASSIIGDFSGALANSGERIELEDAAGNPADAVRYIAAGWSDGGGSSLELRDPRSDNANPAAWADSDETGKSAWQTFTYRTTAGQRFGPTMWNEMRLGLLDAGDCLIDDLSVKANPEAPPPSACKTATSRRCPRIEVAPAREPSIERRHRGTGKPGQPRPAPRSDRPNGNESQPRRIDIPQ